MEEISLKFQLYANDVADFDMVNSTGYDFVLEFLCYGSGGKPWILNRIETDHGYQHMVY